MLEKSIAPVCLGVAPKNTDPLLEGIYIEAKDGTLTMCSYDREKGIRTTLEAEVEREGKIVVDAQKTSAIIHSLPDGPVTIEADENLIMRIVTEEADFQISGKDASNYPGLPDVKGDLNYTLQQNKIRAMINKTLFAVSQDDSKPIYTSQSNSLSVYRKANGALLLDAYHPNQRFVKHEIYVNDILNAIKDFLNK